MASADEILQSKFVTVLGLSEQKAKETLKNASLTKNLSLAISALEKQKKDLSKGASANLIYHLCSKIKAQSIAHLDLLVGLVADSKLDTTVRVEFALEFVLSQSVQGTSIDVNALEKYCGVNVVVTSEEIDKAVEEVITKNKKELVEQRYRFNVGKILADVRAKLPWADGKALKSEVDVQIFDLLGVKTEADLAPLPSIKGKKAAKTTAAAAPTAKNETDAEKKEVEDSALTITDLMKKVNFHAPGENYKTDGYVSTPETARLLKEHLKITGNQVRTRFPPEPNGILHIGHAKAININFGYAAAHNGTCFLRYDDTNPEKEEEKFFVGIKDMVEWLGYKPSAITHSSDNFQQVCSFSHPSVHLIINYIF